MSDRHAMYFHRLLSAVETASGDTTAELRQAIAEQSAQISLHSHETEEGIPPVLANFVNKVALHAYKVTDEDIEVLRQAGYSENAIFEITLSAALGAGHIRLERSLAALKGEIRCD